MPVINVTFSGTTKCGFGTFRCHTGVCIPRQLKCDGKDDCGDGSDEQGCKSHLCDTFGVCSHFCLQQGHIPKCYCAPGYVYESSIKCKAQDRDSAVAILLDGQLVRMFRSKPGAPNFVDVTTGKIQDEILSFDYWSPDGKEVIMYYIKGGELFNGTLDDMVSDKVTRKTRDISGIVNLKVPPKYSKAIYIAFDWVHRNIYSVHSNTGIKRSAILVRKNVNPEKFVELIGHDLGIISSLAVSSREGKIYWASTEPYPAIEMANLDGSNRETIVLKDIHEPKSLIVDEFNRRLYWVDTLKGSIESARLDGTDRQTIKKYGYQNGTLHDKPSSIDIFDDYLYIVGMPGGTVWRTHKFGNFYETTVKKVKAVNPLASLKVVHPTKRFADRPSVCITENICGPQPCITINETPKCLCDANEYFDGGKCIQLRWLFAADKPCGDKSCKHGGVCDSTTKTCRCPPGSYGAYCENSLCTNACMNEGTCSIQFNVAKQESKAICNCPIEFMGDRCERFKCTGLCGPTGTCKIDEQTGLAYCKCDEGYLGPNCDIHLSTESNTCDDFCYNDGKCSLASESKPFCQCGSHFSGRRCENCVNKDTELEIVCLNGGYCKKDSEMCVCPVGFIGKNCGQDLCKNYCLNGGECLRNGTLLMNPVTCICQKGFSGKRCEENACSRNETICHNDGICVPKPDGEAFCACTSRFTGKSCEEKRDCEDYCLNESECEEVDEASPDPANKNLVKQWKCICKPGYAGERCENLDACEGICENGSVCKLDKDKGPICDCPSGLYGNRCNIINATSCKELTCSNFGQCLKPSSGSPKCICRFGWHGLICSEPTCDNYCQNGGSCFIQDGYPICRCPSQAIGIHCEIQIPSLAKTEDGSPVGTMISMFISVVILCVLALFIMYFIFIRNDRRGIKLFRHQRMFNEPAADADMDEFHNPAFMADEDERHVDETTNFTNPSYVSFTNGVYNDTVERPDDYDTSPAVIVTSSTIHIPTSEKKKLLSDPLQSDQQ